MKDEWVFVLRDAIIMNAVDEYKKSLATISRLIKRRDMLIRNQEYMKVRFVTSKISEVYTDDVERIERFFNSQWFGELTTIKPEAIIEHCRKEYGIDYHPYTSSSILCKFM